MGIHGTVIARMGEYQAGLAEARRVLERAQELDYTTEIAFAHGVISLIHIIAGNVLHSALESANIVIEKAEQTGDWGYVCLGHGITGWIEARLSRFEEAEASMAQAYAILQEKLDGHYVMADLVTAAGAELALHKGQIQEAIELAQKAISMAQTYGGVYVEGFARRVWGQALAKMTPPEWEGAEEQMEESLRLLESGQNRLTAARTQVAWGEMCRARGDLEAAHQHWEVAASQFETSGLTDELERTRALMDGLD